MKKEYFEDQLNKVNKKLKDKETLIENMKRDYQRLSEKNKERIESLENDISNSRSNIEKERKINTNTKILIGILYKEMGEDAILEIAKKYDYNNIETNDTIEDKINP